MKTLRIKPLNEVTEEFYTEHGHFHSGDSGIDLYFYEDQIIPPNTYSVKIPMGVAAEMIDHQSENNAPYWLLPRSSVYKTPLRQCNSMGLIDRGYCGELMVFVDNLSNEPVEITKGQRLFQITAMDGQPLTIELTNELSDSTRGEGGFGSTGE